MSRGLFIVLTGVIVLGVAGFLMLRWSAWSNDPVLHGVPESRSDSGQADLVANAWRPIDPLADERPLRPANVPADALLIEPADWALDVGARLRLPVADGTIEVIVDHVEVVPGATTLRGRDDAGARVVLTQGRQSRFGNLRLPGGLFEIWGDGSGTWLYRPFTRANPDVPDFRVRTPAAMKVADAPAPPALGESSDL